MGADRSAGRYIAVEGPIGVGKTALARRLATEFGSRARSSSRSRRTRFSGSSTRTRSSMRSRPSSSSCSSATASSASWAQLELFGAAGPSPTTSSPRTASSPASRSAPDELALYQQIFQLLDQQLPRPDLVIYLEARPEVLLRRLRKRDRDFERGITPGVPGDA